MTDLAAAPGTDADTRPDRLRWGLVLAAAVVLCALPFVLFGTRFEAWAERVLPTMAGNGGVAGLVVALLALDTILPVPSSVLATVAGQRLGFGLAGGAIFVGLCLGNVTGYLIGRLAGAPVVARMVGPDQVAWAHARVSTRPGAAALFLTRPIPILSESAVVLAGAAAAPVARTAAVCGLANGGMAAVYAGLGSQAHGSLAVPLVMAGAVGVPVLGFLLFLVDKRRSDAAHHQ